MRLHLLVDVAEVDDVIVLGEPAWLGSAEAVVPVGGAVDVDASDSMGSSR
jgi:hypothetical protein